MLPVSIGCLDRHAQKEGEDAVRQCLAGSTRRGPRYHPLLARLATTGPELAQEAPCDRRKPGWRRQHAPTTARPALEAHAPRRRGSRRLGTPPPPRRPPFSRSPLCVDRLGAGAREPWGGGLSFTILCRRCEPSPRRGGGSWLLPCAHKVDPLAPPSSLSLSLACHGSSRKMPGKRAAWVIMSAGESSAPQQIWPNRLPNLANVGANVCQDRRGWPRVANVWPRTN